LSPPTAPALELLPLNPAGRVFNAHRVVRLGDVDPTARLRLDATSRFLQDVATDDAKEARLDGRLGWVVRRTMIEVIAPARLDEHVELATFCTGIGRSWAERRTTIRGAGVDGDKPAAHVEAVSLWVQIDTTTGRPAALTDDFERIYGAAAAGRRVTARLALDHETAGADRREPWHVRRTDLDPFDHVNNAANWSFVEEIVDWSADDHRDRRGRGEMEFLLPIDRSMSVDVVSATGLDGVSGWLVDGERVLSAARWTPAPAA
jgi:acyl-ACP thioesterase